MICIFLDVIVVFGINMDLYIIKSIGDFYFVKIFEDFGRFWLDVKLGKGLLMFGIIFECGFF